MKILLVDDEAELTDPLSRVLSREGYIEAKGEIALIHAVYSKGYRFGDIGDWGLGIRD